MTARELYDIIMEEPDRLEVAVTEFLNSFYLKSSIERSELVRESPNCGYHGDPEAVFVAAMVHQLCIDTNTTVPEWIWEDRYYSKVVMSTKGCKLKPIRVLFYGNSTGFDVRNLTIEWED